MIESIYVCVGGGERRVQVGAHHASHKLQVSGVGLGQ